MLKKIILIGFAVISFAGITSVFAGANSINVNGGYADYKGFRYLVIPGVKSVSPIPEDSVYGNGISYDIKTKNMKESENEAQKVMNFYKNKNIGGVIIKNEFDMTKGKSEVYYNSSNKNAAGKNVTIMLSLTKDQLSVLIIPN